MRHRRPPRLPSFDYRGRYRYFATCCSHDRRRAFVHAAVVDTLEALIVRTCEERDFSPLAYTFMPDHLHLLVEGESEQAHFPSFMTLVLKRTAIAFQHLEGGPLWQRGYYERVLRREEESETVMRYIAGNPIRAGLVEKVGDYPFTFLRGGCPPD